MPYKVRGVNGFYRDWTNYRRGKVLSYTKEDMKISGNVIDFSNLYKLVDQKIVDVRLPFRRLPWQVVVSGWDGCIVEYALDLLLGEMDNPDYITAEMREYSSGSKIVTIRTGYFDYSQDHVRVPYSCLDLILKRPQKRSWTDLFRFTSFRASQFQAD